MRVATATLIAACSACLIGHGSTRAAEHAEPRSTAANTIVDRFLSSDEPALTSYRALRVLEAEARGGKMHARLTAWTSLDPVEGLHYSIVEETGSEVIRAKVLRAALEAERALVARGDVQRGALTLANYELGADEDAENGLVRIRLRPRRRDTLLIDGSMLLAEPEGDLQRVEGFLIKRPSFWTREVHVVRRYARIDGVRVPVATESTARVLVVGRSRFSMVYDYAAINGAPVTTASER